VHPEDLADLVASLGADPTDHALMGAALILWERMLP